MKELTRLTISENKRFLTHEDGSPFFWLGDTAWELFHRLRMEEVEFYLKNRKKKKFTIIQSVALAEFDGLNGPNAYGDRPFVNNDPYKPNESYWKFIDSVIDKALGEGIYIGLLPTWGDKVADLWGEGPILFEEESAFAYGHWLGKRYKGYTNLVWILGGDRPAVYTGIKSGEQKNDIPIWGAMASGLRESLDFPPLITYHPSGGHSSSEYIHQAEWLDFNMMQSGHGSGHDVAVWEKIKADYDRVPTKPTLDGEPNYEDHPVNPWPEWDPKSGYFDDYDVRKQLYRSVFAGGAGVTYGHHSVWQMCGIRYPAINHAKMDWLTALDRPGASQVQYLRMLMESRPFASRIPDQSLLVQKPTDQSHFPVATRDEAGSYAMIYLPVSDPILVDLTHIEASQINVWWFNPENGSALLDGKYSGGANQVFQPPDGRKDWVLVLDSTSNGYLAPGLNDS